MIVTFDNLMIWLADASLTRIQPITSTVYLAYRGQDQLFLTVFSNSSNVFEPHYRLVLVSEGSSIVLANVVPHVGIISQADCSRMHRRFIDRMNG